MLEGAQFEHAIIFEQLSQIQDSFENHIHDIMLDMNEGSY